MVLYKDLTIRFYTKYLSLIVVKCNLKIIFKLTCVKIILTYVRKHETHKIRIKQTYINK